MFFFGICVGNSKAFQYGGSRARSGHANMNFLKQKAPRFDSDLTQHLHFTVSGSFWELRPNNRDVEKKGVLIPQYFCRLIRRWFDSFRYRSTLVDCNFIGGDLEFPWCF